jgi:Alpha/beta hydrolase domain
MVEISGPVTAGRFIEPASVPIDLPAKGYVEQEFFASGTASAYDLAGEVGSDGRWVAKASGTAPFCTRVVVRRPADPARFSGTLLLEWLNVSAGFEVDADWSFLYEEIFRQGHAYAAVSAQARGVLGGESQPGFPLPPSPGLRASDPVRYGCLAHPGDQYAFDIFGQIGRALKAASPALGGLVPARVLALGDSQSAVYLTSYINAVHPLSPVFDGFFVHSRGAGAGPLSGAGIDPPAVTVGVRIRADNRTPVLILESEGDIVPPLAFELARQPDSDWLRLWEAAGTAHADAFLIGAVAGSLGWRINEGPHRFVAQAATASCYSRTGRSFSPRQRPSPSRPRLACDDEGRLGHSLVDAGLSPSPVRRRRPRAGRRASGGYVRDLRISRGWRAGWPGREATRC